MQKVVADLDKVAIGANDDAGGDRCTRADLDLADDARTGTAESRLGFELRSNIIVGKNEWAGRWEQLGGHVVDAFSVGYLLCGAARDGQQCLGRHAARCGPAMRPERLEVARAERPAPRGSDGRSVVHDHKIRCEPAAARQRPGRPAVR